MRRVLVYCVKKIRSKEQLWGCYGRLAILQVVVVSPLEIIQYIEQQNTPH